MNESKRNPSNAQWEKWNRSGSIDPRRRTEEYRATSPAWAVAELMVNDTLVNHGENTDHLKAVLKELRGKQGYEITQDAMGDYFGVDRPKDIRVAGIPLSGIALSDIKSDVITLFSDFLNLAPNAKADFLANLRDQQSPSTF